MSEEQKDKQEGPQGLNRHDGAHHDVPEPPSSWKPFENTNTSTLSSTSDGEDQKPGYASNGDVMNNVVKRSNDDATSLESARKLISIAQISAIVSLFIGGVLLSSVSIGFAISGLVKLNAIATKRAADQAERTAIRRPGILVLALCIGALVVNIISLVYLYPILMQNLQTGGYSSLFGGLGSGGSSAGSGSSAWG